MEISRTALSAVLSQFNPWWRGEKISGLPTWRRAVFDELLKWIVNPPAPRAILLSGARQVGKTTLLRQSITELLNQGVPASNIVYITFDHPLIKLAGIEAVLNAWREREIAAHGKEYIFVDEAQFVPDWGTWIKHQTDFSPNRRIIFTGSALPLIDAELESNVGRTHTIRLATLSFFEYLQLKKAKGAEQFYELPKIDSIEGLFSWSTKQFEEVAHGALPYSAYFNDYLARGGFPQAAIVKDVMDAQALLREDIVDKVLKRDMTALFGVRRIQELEQTFLYLCMHDGGQLDMEMLSGNLGVKRPTAKRFIELLASTHLIYRLSRFGYGKEVLRGREKIYLADPAIAPAVFLKGKAFLENSTAFGLAVETAAFKHLCAHYANTTRFTYWLSKSRREVDVIAEQADSYVPFEIKQRADISVKSLRGLLEFCQAKDVKQAYVVTKSMSDFGVFEQDILPATKIIKIPAPLFCYWLGAMELRV